VTPAGVGVGAGADAAVAAAAGRGVGVGVGVLDTGIAASGDLAGRVVASADLSGEWSFTDSYGHGTFMAGPIAGSGGPRPRCRSAPLRAWSGGCAATTRCCTRAGSGPPTWSSSTTSPASARPSGPRPTSWPPSPTRCAPRSPRSRATGDPSGPRVQPVGGQAPGHAADCGRAGRPPGPAGRGPAAGVADLLGAGRLGRGRHAREYTNLAEAARRAAADWLRGPDSRLELELPAGPLEVDADPLRLVQVLAKLIPNAHKYSPPTRRCGCGCGATTAGRWRRSPTAAGHPPGGAGPGVREVPPGRGPDDHDHRGHRPRPLHRPRADQGHGRRGRRGGRRDRGDSTQPRGTRARRLPDPLCRSS
jgi:hypothetical protein